MPPKCLVSEHLMEAGTGRFEYKSDLVRKRIEQELNMKKVFASLSKKQKKLLVTSHKKCCYHRIGYLTERLKTQCLRQKSENVFVAQLDRALAS